MKLFDIKMALQNILLEFKRWEAEGGYVIETNEEELVEGLEVIVYDPEGNRMELPDGEYLVNKTKVTIFEGKVKSIETIEEVIEKPEVEVEVENACGDKKEVKAEDEKDVRIAELEAVVAERDETIKEMAAKIEEKDKRIAELEKQPAAKPVEQEFEQTKEMQKTGNKKIDRMIEILNA